MTYGGRPHEEEHPGLVSKDPRSTGLVEDCAAGQGSHWTVTTDDDDDDTTFSFYLTL
jgi:hypothetical protein